MSVRVNLLPRDVGERARARRQWGALALLGVLLLAGLAGLWFLQTGRVNDARQELEAAEQQRDALQRDVRALEQFAELERRQRDQIELLARAFATEISVAGILQDVAAIMPSDAALLQLAIALTPEGSDEDFDVGGTSFGRISATGESLRGHAPGVERFLLEFDKVAAFFNVYFSVSEVDEFDIATFNFEIDLGGEVFTFRYAEGLPEGVR